MEPTIDELREILKKYEEKLKKAGWEVQYYDYNLGMGAIKEGHKGIYICYQFRPERDGYTGYELIEEDYLDEIIEKYK